MGACGVSTRVCDANIPLQHPDISRCMWNLREGGYLHCSNQEAPWGPSSVGPLCFSSPEPHETPLSGEITDSDSCHSSDSGPLGCAVNLILLLFL